MRRFCILIVGPYPKFEEAARPIIAEFPNVDFELRSGDEFSAISIFNAYPQNTFDAIVTRGAIAAILRQVTSIPVVEIDVSLLDILQAINQPDFSEQHVAVVGYSSIISSAKKVFEVLRLTNVEIHEVYRAEVKGRVAELADRGITMIIGDSPSVIAAETNGLRALLIRSSDDCIRQAIIAAIYYSELMSKGQEMSQIFQTVVENIKFRIILMDQVGNIIIDNNAFQIVDQQAFQKELLLSIPILLQQPSNKVCKKIGPQDVEIIGKCVSYCNKNCFLFFISQIQKGYSSQVDITIEKASCKISSPQFIEALCANNPRIQSIVDVVSVSVHPAPVIILGEYGTGKSSLARYLHSLRKEKNAPFIFVRCNHLSRKRWTAFINKANSPLNENGCTLYLENVHLLSPELQNELSSYIIDSAADRRHFIISSSTSKIHHLLSNDQFLYPFYQKISSLQIVLSPLRNSPTSVSVFAKIFLSSANQEYQKNVQDFGEGVLELLARQLWNTNLSQLKTFIQQLVLTARSPYITFEEANSLLSNENTISSDETIPTDSKVFDLTKTLDEIEYDIIQYVLVEENMNQSAAAKRLGISRNTIWRKLRS